MKALLAASILLCIGLTGCGGGGDAYIAVTPTPTPERPTYEYLTHPTISGLEYLNSATGSESHLTTAAGAYTGYTGNDSVAFVLGDILLFTMPGDLLRPFSSL